MSKIKRQSPIAWCVIAIVRFYRITLGPMATGRCRFHPTCSQYMLDAVDKYGGIRGGWKGVMRICRCHPWNDGGVDPA